jgi:hypothetical protein
VQLGYNNVTHLALIKANTNESIPIAADLSLYNSTLLSKLDSGNIAVDLSNEHRRHSA